MSIPVSPLETSSFNTSSLSFSSVPSSLHASVPLRTTRPCAFFERCVSVPSSTYASVPSPPDIVVPSSTDTSRPSLSDQPDFVSDSSVVDYAFSWPNYDSESELQPASASSSEPSPERIAAAASGTSYL